MTEVTVWVDVARADHDAVEAICPFGAFDRGPRDAFGGRPCLTKWAYALRLAECSDPALPIDAQYPRLLWRTIASTARYRMALVAMFDVCRREGGSEASLPHTEQLQAAVLAWLRDARPLGVPMRVGLLWVHDDNPNV